LFDGDLLAPGDGETRCVVVTSTGSLPAEVRMYGTGAAATNGLADSILLTITEGTGGSFGDCSGFTPGTVLFDGTLAQFAAAAGAYAEGLGDWTTAGGTQSRTFQLGYTLDPASPDSVQGGTATISFTWEAQSI